MLCPGNKPTINLSTEALCLERQRGYIILKRMEVWEDPTEIAEASFSLSLTFSSSSYRVRTLED